MKGCEVCGKRGKRILFEVDGKKVVKCGGCGVVRTDGFEMPDYGNYHRDEEYVCSSKLFENIFRKRFLIIKRFKKNGRVFDIGASSGEMLRIFNNDGWECWGVEPSAVAERLRYNDIKILREEFEEAKLPNNYFDVVILNHTLEHMNNPLAVMEKVGKILKSDGIVLVDVPNFDALSRLVMGRRWPFFLPCEHKWHFTPGSLGEVFRRADLEVVHWESRSGIFEYANPIGDLALSLVTFKKRFFSGIIGAPGAALATALGRGASFSMVGRK